MLRYALVLSSLIGAILLAVPQVMSQGIVAGFRFCPGDFALCAASICTPTGAWRHSRRRTQIRMPA